MDKPKKDQIKAKAKAVKEKAKAVKGKMKGAKCVALLFALVTIATGCMTPNQASRGTSNENGDIEPSVDVTVNGSSNTVSVVIRGTYGDGAIASADSSGSTESQTQTPTFDISPKTDLRYNDAMAAATTASRGVLEVLTEAGANKVLSMMADKSTGTVQVQQKDGSTATVSCKDGQCEILSGNCPAGNCTDCKCPSGACAAGKCPTRTCTDGACVDAAANCVGGACVDAAK